MINSWTQEWNSVNCEASKTRDRLGIIPKKYWSNFKSKQITFVSSTCKVISRFLSMQYFVGNCNIYLLAVGGLFQPRNIAAVKIPFQEAIYTIIIIHRKEDLVSFLSEEKKAVYQIVLEDPSRNLSCWFILHVFIHHNYTTLDLLCCPKDCESN